MRFYFYSPRLVWAVKFKCIYFRQLLSCTVIKQCSFVFFRHFVASPVIMADAFSSSSENVIQRVSEVKVKKNTPQEELEELYQIKNTCEFIGEHHFGKVRTYNVFIYLLLLLMLVLNDLFHISRLLCSSLMSCWLIQWQ